MISPIPRMPVEFQYASKQFSKWTISELALEDAWAICNRLTRCSNLSKLTVRDGYRVFSKMRVALAPKSYVYSRARRLFDASVISQLLSGMLLNKSRWKQFFLRPGTL